MRETITISVTNQDAPKLKEIRNFCKKHRINFSGVMIDRVVEWYDKNKKTIQKSFYKLKPTT